MGRYLILLILSVMLSACSLTGLDSSDDLACKAPDGVSCMSATGVYTNSLSDNLPAQRSVSSAESSSSSTSEANAPTNSMSKDSAIRRAQIPGTGTAIRSAPRVLRLWVAPWEDSDGDLHDQFYVYLTVDPGRWVIEHQRNKIQQEYSPTTLKSSSGVSMSSSPTTKSNSLSSKGTENVKP